MGDIDLTLDDRLTAMGLLAEVVHGINAAAAEQLDGHDLALLDFEVLVRLSRSPGQKLRMADLAAQVAMSASGLTRVIDRLERAGLVAREACPTDRRGTHAVLTPAGRERLLGALPGHLDVIERTYTGVLGPAALPSFLTALRTVREVVHPDAVAGVDTAAAHTAADVAAS